MRKLLENMTFNLEDRLILLTSPGTLSRIASFKLALYCWQQHIKNNCDSSLFVEVKTTIRVSDVFKVSLPKRIMDLINRHTELLKWKLYSWSKFHSSNVYGTSHNNKNIIFNCLDCVVLKPSGSIICFESTAKNLMASDRLSMMQKYSIACTYCFTEHIKDLWPLIPDNCLPSSPAMNYWNNINRNICVDLPEIQSVNPGWYLPSNLKYWRMSEANIPEKIMLSTINVEDETSLDTVLFLLSNLDTTRQNELIREFSITLLRVLALQDEEPSIRTLQLWHHVKDNITNDQFRDLINLLCKAAFDIFRNIDSYVAVLLDEIWIAASNHQQTEVMNCSSFHFIIDPLTLVSSDMRNYGKGIGFYLHILSGLSIEKRDKFWCRYWENFIYVARVSELNSLMGLCLNNADEVAEFIELNFANYSVLMETLRRFILAGKYQELTEYLIFVDPNEKSVRKMQQTILNSLLEDDLEMWVANEYMRSFCNLHSCRFNLYSNQCIEFNNLVDNAFPSKDSALQFKKDFILHYVKLRKYTLGSSFMLEEIRDMAEAFFSSDQRCLIEMKLKIYEFCRPFAVIKPGTELHIRTRIMREWQEFYKWCGFEEEPSVKIGLWET